MGRRRRERGWMQRRGEGERWCGVWGVGCGSIRWEGEKKHDSIGGRVALSAWDIWVEIWEDGAREWCWACERGGEASGRRVGKETAEGCREIINGSWGVKVDGF